VISMLCLFQVTANGSRSVELKDGDYLIFNMETMPQSIKSFDVYLAVNIFFPGDLLDLLESDDCFH